MNQKAFQDYYPDELSHCYGCGRLNEHGLQLKSYWDGEETVAVFQPKPYHIAIPDYVYGGLIASLIDCHATGTAAAAMYRQEGREMHTEPSFRFVTASLQVDYIRPTPLGVPLEVRGRVKEIKGRKVVVSTTVSANGEVCAEGKVVAVQMPEHMMPKRTIEERMPSICVFLGSNPGADGVYARATEEMGRALAARGLTCVYGGSNTGLMKLLADSVLESGGKVIGVTVKALRDKEIFHPGLTELHVVSTMHERKALMEKLSDGFVALPGGIGTFEEFFEVYTLSQLGFHSKPCGLLNINNYYAPLDALLDNAEREGFLKSPHRQAVIRADNPADMLRLMVSKL